MRMTEQRLEAPVQRIFAAVHVVTVTHNSETTLEPWLRGLRASGMSISGLTVVDNASTDRTVATLRSMAHGCPFPVEVLEDENTGFAGGYAAAARTPLDDGPPVLCLNPDVILGDGAVEAMLDVLNSFDDAAVVTVPLVETDGSPDSASRRRLPTLGSSMLYSVLGRVTPTRFRYNAQRADPRPQARSGGGWAVSALEATTGAVMLVAPDFRSLSDGIFDRDYWMYGEDLQLCVDARASGRRVLMAEMEPSVHIKGVSSGRPRSRRSNRAFHDAMMIYARKNLIRRRLARAGLYLAIEVHFHFQELVALPARLRRKRES